MELFFSALACSAASRISLYEAEQIATFVEVDPKTKRTSTGEDFHSIHPLGLVPTLRLKDGTVLSENAAILQYIADRFPEARLAPTAGLERARLAQWLSFIGTELHKALFVPLLDEKAPPGARAYALQNGDSRMGVLDTHLQKREYLLERFSVADAYLVVVLNWCAVTPVEITRWPAVAAYQGRLRRRPSVARALAEELTLYQLEQARHAAKVP